MSVDPTLRASIEDLIADCAHAIDDDELERWPDFFTEDAVYQIISRENFDAGLPMGVMICEGRGMMADRVMALRTANIYEPHTYCHILGRTRIAADGDSFAARTNIQVVRTMQDGGMAIYATGKYIDRIVLEDGAPLLADRRVVLESRRVDILLVFPL